MIATDKRNQIITVLLRGVLTILVIRYLAFYDFSFRIIILFLLIVISLLVLTAGENGFYIGMLFWVGMFGIGYRIIELTPNLRVLPLKWYCED